MAALICLSGNICAQKGYEALGITFTSEKFGAGDTRLPYRQAVISAAGKPERLVLYLHGGTSKGYDNTSQLDEPGIDSIACFAAAEGTGTLFVAPQCPPDGSWGGRLTDALAGLVGDRTARFPGIADVYIFGGSMGGTGTWTMISKYPALFSAAMPVAGNPSKCDAGNVSQTPFLTVMGTGDRIMSIEAVGSFTSQLDGLGARYVFETEEGWTHEDVCIKSYTRDRLAWVFSNSRRQQDESGISRPAAGAQTAVDTRYWTMSGIPVPTPSKGLYIVRRTYPDNTTKVSKEYISGPRD